MPRAALLFLLLGSLIAAGPAAAREEILSFHSHIIVRADAVLEVIETIEVRVEGIEIRRGLLRDFPTSYKNPDGTRVTTSFEVENVQLNGGAVNWKTERLSNGKRLRIGSRDVLLRPGVYTYTIRYLTRRQLYFGDAAEDQLYYNVTGNGWAFPILEASAEVVLPEGASATRSTAFTGSYGSTEGAFAQFTSDGGYPGFRTLRTLNRGEGLTVAVGWPAGFVTRPDAADEAAIFLQDNRAVFAAGIGLVVVFGYFLLAWHMAGRDPEGGAIIARYEPPRGFSPAAVHFVANMGFSDTAFTAAIVNMAVKGFLTIREDNDGDMTLHVEGDKSRLTRGERAVASRLFQGRAGSLEIDQDNHEKLSDARSDLRDSLSYEYEAAHFIRNLGLFLGGLGLAAVSVVVSLMLSDPLSIPTIVLLVATIATVPIFYFLLKAPTRLGRRVMDEIEGFRHYLQVAEADRLQFHNPPEQTPALFEKYLPYAIALGVEHEWGEKFDDILAAASLDPAAGQGGYHPHWYHSSRGYGGFRSSSFSSSMGAAFTGAISAASTAPSSSGGGFSGGGFSGGGGGGGGGGGW
jgi:hypothetical protein